MKWDCIKSAVFIQFLRKGKFWLWTTNILKNSIITITDRFGKTLGTLMNTIITLIQITTSDIKRYGISIFYEKNKRWFAIILDSTYTDWDSGTPNFKYAKEKRMDCMRWVSWPQQWQKTKKIMEKIYNITFEFLILEETGSRYLHEESHWELEPILLPYNSIWRNKYGGKFDEL